MHQLQLPFRVLQTSRHKLMQLLTQTLPQDLKRIPQGRKNHLYWQAGHMIVSFHLLTYARCGLALPMPESWPPLFRKGSDPQSWTEKTGLPTVTELANAAQGLVDQMEQDYLKGAFNKFEAYETSFGVVLQSFEDAFLYAHLHEGIHWGLVQSMQREMAVAPKN